MGASGTELALNRAIVWAWDNGPLHAGTNGLYWKTAPPTVPGSDPPAELTVPFGVYDVIANAGDGYSNKSAYREITVQFRFYHTNQEDAMALLDRWTPYFEDIVVSLGPGEGQLVVTDKGNVRQVEESPNNWFAACDFAMKRRMERTRR